MHSKLMTSSLVEQRHIIRFTNKREFNQCLAWIKKLRPHFKKLSTIQPIYTLNAICCSLRSSRPLLKHRGIKYIEEDLKIKYHLSHMPPVTSIPWGVKEINSPQAWRKARGRRIKIGIIDTGVDFSHPDLRTAIAGGVNFTHRFLPPYDDNGHGTHIAGTIAARQHSLKDITKSLPAAKKMLRGVIGVAPQSSIYALKCFDKNGSAFVSDIILGIDWCIRNKLNIINMSFGMENKSISLWDSIKIAHDAGLIIVASAGNEGKSGDIDYPARFKETIAVGATNRNKEIAPFSNRSRKIDVYAPGERIYSAWTDRRYNVVSGTSMATSHVTGVIALLLSVRPSLKTKRIKMLLRKTATPLRARNGSSAGGGDGNGRSGRNTMRSRTSTGEVNALKAVQACLKLK